MIESEYLKDSKDIIDKIKRIPSLESFDEEDLQGLLRMSKIRKYNAGELILEEDSYDSWIYYLITGKVKIVRQEKILGYLQRTGDLFGEMGIIDGSARSASVYAVGETVCMATDISYHDRLSGHDKMTFGYLLFKMFSEILANRLRVTNGKYIEAEKEIARLRALVSE